MDTMEAGDVVAERFEMRANFEGLVQLLAKNLYHEPDVFVRELIQNAHDGIRRRQHVEPDLAGRIDVAIDAGARTISIRDNGIGMNRSDIREFLSVIGSTGTGTARTQLANADAETAHSLIGQFGVGALAAFVVADRLTVSTRRIDSAAGWRWENRGTTECLLQPADRDAPGTEIVVHVAHAYAYMLSANWVRAAIIRYCDFIPFGIHVDGEGPVNAVQAPWHRGYWTDEREREAAYRSFLARRFTDYPIDIIPIEIDAPVRARGVLYISDGRIPDVNAAGFLDIYVRRMFVRGNDRDLLPSWAKFVGGVVDCPDLTPTAARDNVQRDEAFHGLAGQLGGLVIRRLEHLAREEAEKFRELCSWHHYHLSAMAVLHDEFFTAVKDLLLFETNRGLLPLTDCVCGPGSSGAGGPALHYFPAREDAQQYFALADANDVVVINAGHLFEEELLAKFVQSRGGGLRLIRMDTEQDSLFFQPPSGRFGERLRRLEQDVEAALRRAGQPGVTATIRRFDPPGLPAVALLSADAAAEARLTRLLQHPWFAESLLDATREVLAQPARSGLRLVLNEAHPLITQLLEEGRGSHDRHHVFCGLFLAACLRARNVLTDDVANVVTPSLLRLLSAAMDGTDGGGFVTPPNARSDHATVH